MGEMVEFASNGGTGGGYLAAPEVGAGIGLIVIQEWWGLVPHIKEVCDRFAAEGFTALAPDLYHGTTVKNSEPDEAGKLLMALNLDQAAKDFLVPEGEAGRHDHLSVDELDTLAAETTRLGNLVVFLAGEPVPTLQECCARHVVPLFGTIARR
jgi:hypothetical protein